MRLPIQNVRRGFTLVEITVVIVIIGILSALVYTLILANHKERTYYVRGLEEMNSMANAVTLYVAKYNEYPADAVRDVPAGIKEFIQGQYSNWPDAPWPGSVYDYDSWPPDGNGPLQTYQISVRFCDAGDDAGCKAKAQKYLKEYVAQTVLDSWDSNSAVYYCIKGSCRSHQSKPLDWPGYCINCGDKSHVF